MHRIFPAFASVDDTCFVLCTHSTVYVIDDGDGDVADDVDVDVDDDSDDADDDAGERLA